jgi:hypothetical protein
VTLEQHDVFPTQQGEVVRSGGADDAATDDDDAGVLGKRGRCRHVLVPKVRANPCIRVLPALAKNTRFSA